MRRSRAVFRLRQFFARRIVIYVAIRIGRNTLRSLDSFASRVWMVVCSLHDHHSLHPCRSSRLASRKLDSVVSRVSRPASRSFDSFASRITRHASRLFFQRGFAMTPALWAAKTGLDAQQTRMTVTSNNLANVSTSGYKKSRGV